MKKTSLLLIIASALAFTITSCGSEKAPVQTTDSSGVKEIDTTFVDSTSTKVIVDTTVATTAKKDTTTKK